MLLSLLVRVRSASSAAVTAVSGFAPAAREAGFLAAAGLEVLEFFVAEVFAPALAAGDDFDAGRFAAALGLAAPGFAVALFAATDDGFGTVDSLGAGVALVAAALVERAGVLRAAGFLAAGLRVAEAEGLAADDFA